MSIPKNTSNAFMPHLEARRSSATLASAGAELVHDVNGDDSATIFIDCVGTTTCTYFVEASADGTVYFPLLTYPYAAASIGGTLPQAGQPLYTEALAAVVADRLLCCAVGQLRKIRIRISALSGGALAVVINSDACASISPYVRDQKAATLTATATGAAAAAVTLTIPAVTGLRHYIDRIDVVRSATAALTAAAAPVVVTTTNIPGAPALTFGADAGGIGADKLQSFEFGGSGLAAIAAGTATTIVCPAYVGVIWRVNASYRLGL